MSAELERLLDRTALRLAFRTRLARAGWLGLAAVVVLELGSLAARGVGPVAFVLGAVGAGALGLGALGALAWGSRPRRTAAAREVDRALAHGALIETAAEALEDRHGPLGSLTVERARRASAGLSAARVLPLEAPRGLWLGGGAALLLLALALGPASEAAPAPSSEPTLVWDSSPGNVGGASQTPAPLPGPTTLVARPVEPGAASPLASPAPSPFTPEETRAILDKIRELEPKLAARPAGGQSGSSEESKARADLADAIARGDADAVEKALEKLAAHGTEASAAALEKAAGTLARGEKNGHEHGTGAGAGSAKGDVTPTPTLPRFAGEGADFSDAARAAREGASWRVREAERRYRQALEDARGGS